MRDRFEATRMLCSMSLGMAFPTAVNAALQGSWGAMGLVVLLLVTAIAFAWEASRTRSDQ